MREEDIIRLLRQQQEQGMEELLRHFGPLLRYVIAPILPDREDREECVSEVAMRVWQRIDAYDPAKGSWRAWLTTVARNTAINAASRRRTGEEALHHTTLAPGGSAEEEVLRRERQESLRRALGQLSEEERLLFYRKYYYMQSTRQIASELGITERAAEGKLYRVKKRLRKMLGGEADGG